jgi:lipoprotein
MKKFYMALAAVSLLASCSKENVEPQPKQPQEAQESIDAVDPNTPGAIRLSLSADVAPIELAQDNIFGGDGQEARGTELTVSGPNLNKAITYKITPDAGDKVPALLYLYDNVGGISVNGFATVIHDGKGVNLSLGMLLDPKVAKGGTLKRLADKKMKGTKLSIMIGHEVNGSKYFFTNKGAQKITYKPGEKTTLSNNFLLLKATGLELEYDTAKDMISVKGGKVSLQMQGYLVVARFQNKFPSKMLHHRWNKISENPYGVNAQGQRVTGYADMAEVNRPPVGVTLSVDNLSGTYQTLIEHNNTLDRFKIGEDVDNTDYQDPNILNKRTMTTGFKKAVKPGFRQPENFLDADAIGEAEIPVGSAKNANQFDNGEQFFLLYCPNPFDRGSIAYRSLMKLYYDGSPFSTRHTENGGYAFCYMKNRKNSFRKTKNATGNKYYYVTFPIESTDFVGGSNYWTQDRQARFDAYKAAQAKYKLN